MIKENLVTNQVATTMDWTATILSVAGAKVNSKYMLDGIDLKPVLTGKKKEVDRTLYWRIFQRTKHKAIREGKWKWLQDEKGNEYLFDLSDDPSEKNNLKEKFTEISRRLKYKYDEWEKTVLAPISL
jgi:arylsulfatase A-like enzyme